MTEKQIDNMIKAARDSVWVINNEIEKLTNGDAPSLEAKGNIERNVAHLKLVVANQEVIDSEKDISDLQTAISDGESKLAENIWPEPEPEEE
jgi:hypothetical protein